MNGRAFGAVLVGLQAVEVTIHATLESGPGTLEISGLPEPSARAARVRVRSALATLDVGPVHVSVSVERLPDAPVDTAGLDLPILVAVLRAAGHAPANVAEDACLVGEIALDGRVRPVRGALPIARETKGPLLVSRENAWEVGLAGWPALLVDRVSDLLSERPLETAPRTLMGPANGPDPADLSPALREILDRIDGRARAQAPFCRESPAGGVLLVGPPGSGKTMIARRVTSAARYLDPDETLEVASIYSAAGLATPGPLPRSRPFRAPHHTCSEAALVGGGDRRRPGEVSLAHRGVLMLDEVTEFRKSALDTLAHVIRAGEVSLPKRDTVARYPARPYAIVAAASPCPCGCVSSRVRRCSCSADMCERHERRLRHVEAALGLERIDVPEVTLVELQTGRI